MVELITAHRHLTKGSAPGTGFKHVAGLTLNNASYFINSSYEIM